MRAVLSLALKAYIIIILNSLGADLKIASDRIVTGEINFPTNSQI